jgi:hypothetical protein
MANTPKIADPRSGASAIRMRSRRENAPEPEAGSPPPPAAGETQAQMPEPLTDPVSEPPWRTVRSGAPTADEVSGEEQELAALRAPANDDRESIGAILRSLQRRPARTSYLYATVFSVLWLIAGLVLGWM